VLRLIESSFSLITSILIANDGTLKRSVTVFSGGGGVAFENKEYCHVGKECLPKMFSINSSRMERLLQNTGSKCNKDDTILCVLSFAVASALKKATN
jgi:hypothetical protein